MGKKKVGETVRWSPIFFHNYGSLIGW
jgi:hypothetical protein